MELAVLLVSMMAVAAQVAHLVEMAQHLQELEIRVELAVLMVVALAQG
jgi:hypothetical protein